jgi:glycosyltransferase involved in cell wall biosynthesis
MAETAKTNPRSRPVLVGDGPLRSRLERRHPEAIFTGFVPRDELARHYASADVFIHASTTETFGNVLTEAMASGVAAATFDYAAARLFVRSGENGLAVPLDQPDALVTAAGRLAADGPLRQRLGKTAAKDMEERSWEKILIGFESDLLQAAEGSQ